MVGIKRVRFEKDQIAANVQKTTEIAENVGKGFLAWPRAMSAGNWKIDSEKGAKLMQVRLDGQSRYPTL